MKSLLSASLPDLSMACLLAFAFSTGGIGAMETLGTLRGWGWNSAGQLGQPFVLPMDGSGFVSISAGTDHTLALRLDGTLMGWGSNTHGQTTLPEGLRDVRVIAAGGGHNVVVKRDGSVVAWGDNISGQCSVPSGLGSVTAVAAGNSHSVALRADGSVMVWGGNSADRTVPAELSGVTAISAGHHSTLALKSDGTVVGWGDHFYPPHPELLTLSDIVAVATSGFHHMALRSDGTVAVWGGSTPVNTVPSGLGNVKAIAAGPGYCMALKEDGGVVVWGESVSVPASATPQDLGDVVTLAAGGKHAVVIVREALYANPPMRLIRPEGGVGSFQVQAEGGWTWSLSGGEGWLECHPPAEQVDVREMSYTAAPNPGPLRRTAVITLTQGDVSRVHRVVQAPGVDGATGSVVAWGTAGEAKNQVPARLPGVRAIAAGGQHSLALDVNGRVTQWGGSARVPKELGKARGIAAGNQFSFAVREDGTVLAWDSWADTNPIRYVPAGLSGVLEVTAGWDRAAALRSDGTVITWGAHVFMPVPNVPAGLEDVVAIASGNFHMVALKSDGTVMTWHNGTNPLLKSGVPAALDRVVAIAAGGDRTLALRADGMVVEWWAGDLRPQVIMGNCVAVSCGIQRVALLRADGTVDAWNAGPVPAGLQNVMAVSAGADHVLALVRNPLDVHPANLVIPAGGGERQFKIFASGGWSWNVNGGEGWLNCAESAEQFGAHNFSYTVSPHLGAESRKAVITVSSGSVSLTHTVFQYGAEPRPLGKVVSWGNYGLHNTPEVPHDLGGVTAVSAGDGFSLALLEDGTVRAWGWMGHMNAWVPPGLERVVKVAAGRDYALALKEDGTVVDWHGYPAQTWTEVSGAGVPAALQGVVDIAASDLYYGNEISLALKADGSLETWGMKNSNLPEFLDSLGPVTRISLGTKHFLAVTEDGQTAAWGYTPLPQAVVPEGLQDVLTVAAGAQHSLALKHDGTVVAWGMNSHLHAVPRNLREVSFISAAGDISLALKSDGTVTAWGDTSYGQTRVPAGLKNTIAISAGRKHALALVRVPLRLGLGMEVPTTHSATPERAGAVTVKAAPSAALKKDVDGNLDIVPGTLLKVSATPRPGHIFSHWEGLPPGAVVMGGNLSFAMPLRDFPGLKAVFISNPFTQGRFAEMGTKPVFQGLLRPDDMTAHGNDTSGFLTAALASAKGTLSGKVWLDGQVTSFTAELHGDGSVWFKTGKLLARKLPFQGRALELTWSEEGLSATVTAPGGKTSTGLARPPHYNKSRLVRAELLAAAGRQGYYTVAFPSVAQTPPKAAEKYPQGTGIAGLTLRSDGTIKLAGTLADGTKITAATFLVVGDGAEIFIALPTPGARSKNGSLLGTLVFDETHADSAVNGAEMTWFRPAAESKPTVPQPYRAGWPGGIALNAIGALYDAKLPVQTALGLGEPGSGGNAGLVFRDGKLPGEVRVVFNLEGARAVKLDATDKTWSLKLAAGTGLFSGTFTPDWPDAVKQLPSFQGVLLQKGAHAGGHGFFLSNREADLEPESGAVVVGAP